MRSSSWENGRWPVKPGQRREENQHGACQRRIARSAERVAYCGANAVEEGTKESLKRMAPGMLNAEAEVDATFSVPVSVSVGGQSRRTCVSVEHSGGRAHASVVFGWRK